MTNDRPPTALWVSAQIRIAARQGVPITVLHKGDPDSGALALKVNLLNGTALVFTQIHMDDERVWAPLDAGGPLPEREADHLLNEQIGFDPDLWALEIEDREGRLWFPGRIVT